MTSLEESRSGAPTRIRMLVFLLACGASFLLYLHRYSWNIIGPKLQQDLQLTNTQSALLFSLFYYTYATLQIPSGFVVDRFGPHRFVTAIVTAWSLSLIAIAQTSNLLLIGIWRLVFGATQAGCYPALTKVTRQWFPFRQRTAVQGWVATAFGRSGGALSPIILGSLLMGWLGLSWQLAVTLIGLVGLVYGALFWWLFRNTPQDDPRVNRAEQELIADDSDRWGTGNPMSCESFSMGLALKNRSLRFFTVQQFLDAGSDVVFVSLIGTFFLRAHDFDISKTGWLASLPLWGGALGGIAGGWLNDTLIRRTGNRRWSRSGVGFIGKLIGGAMLGLVVMQSSGETAALLLMAAKFFSDWSQPTTWGMCTDLGGRFSATVFGIINTAGTLGGIVMPIIFGSLLDWYTIPANAEAGIEATTNWGPLFVLLTAMYLACGVCWLLIDCTQSLDRPNDVSAAS